MAIGQRQRLVRMVGDRRYYNSQRLWLSLARGYTNSFRTELFAGGGMPVADRMAWKVRVER